jgi:peptidoglycan/LPS O-acetylase OafA/YrhL
MNASAKQGTGTAHRRLAYLPALDGVRAFAVIAVMMYHGGLSITTGGFMGVDTFFVLSGFLITSLLVSEWHETLRIKLSEFWARRARRLLPALLLMLVLVAFFASVVVPKGTYGALRLDSLATLLYVSNWHFILANSNYFAESAQASPLIHTWSLAVEEQFYLIWPLVVLGILRLTKSLRSLFVVCCVAAVGSAVEMVVLFHHAVSTNRVYLGTDTRAQCLFIGCALAVGLVLLTKRSHAEGRLAKGELWKPAGNTGRILCGLGGLVGAALAIIIWVSTSTTSSFPYEGGFFLIGLATAGVILSSIGAPRSPVPRFLSLAPVRYIGRISYGLYIWHWPLFIWVNEARTGISGYGLFAVRAVVTVAASVVSYHLVEQPVRRGTFLRQWRAFVAVPSAVAVVLVAMVTATVGSSAALANNATGTRGAGSIPPPILPTKGTTTTTVATAAGPPVRVLLLGDSIALTLGVGLADSTLQKRYDYQLSDDGILGCGVVNGPQVELMGARYQVGPACDGSSAVNGIPLTKQPWPFQWLNAMAVTHPNVVVLLAGRWEVVDREYQGKWTNILNAGFAAYVKHQLELSASLVNAAGAHMVFLTAPCTDEGESPDGAPWPEDDPARLAEYNKLVHQVAAEHPQTDSVVDLFSATCPGGKYSADVDGVAVRRSDGVHFTAAAGPELGPKIMPAVIAAGRAQMTAAG